METYSIANLRSLVADSLGSSRRIAFLNEDMAVVEDIRQLGIISKPTRTDMAILGICTEGYFRVMVNTDDIYVEENHYLVVVPEQVVNIVAYSRRIEGIFLCISTKLYGELLTRMHDMLPMFFFIKRNPCARLKTSDIEWIRMYHRILFQEMRNENTLFREEIAMGLLSTLFYKVCNIYGQRTTLTLQNDRQAYGRQNDIFTDFIHLLALNYKKHRDLAFYASALCITPKYLSAAVKSVSGQSATEWIENYVLQEAKILLRTSAISVQMISKELGFPNQSFFGKYFKHHLGVSPLTYRHNA